MKKQFDFRSDRFYNSNHLWCKHDGNDLIIVGMDELGLDSLGELAYLALPSIGSEVEMGKVMGSMEAAKMTGELIAPLSGVVVERNDLVLENPLLVNEHPHDEGWLIKIEPTHWKKESTTMFSGERLKPWVKEEIERFENQGILD